MTDAEYEKAKERVNYFLFPLKDILLADWYVRYEYHRTPHEDDPYTQAQASPLWEYRRGTIRLYLGQLAEEEDDSRLVNILMHEMIHFLLEPVLDYKSEDENYRKIVEHTTQSVTDALQLMFERPDLFKQWHEKKKMEDQPDASAKAKSVDK